MLNNRRLVKNLGIWIANKSMGKTKEIPPKKKRHNKKKEYKAHMIKLVGKARWYLSWWFGSWVLYVGNPQLNIQPEYQKFYTTEAVAKRYAKRLEGKYEIVQITKVFNKQKREMGYMLSGRGKKEIETPKNVIQLKKKSIQ
jgi:hypothetical protein